MPHDDTATSFPLASIEIHPRLQPRGRTDHRRVRQYATAMIVGKQFPPIHVGRIGRKLYVIDGHHRLEAAALAGLPTISAITKSYRTLDDAHRAALQANQGHGKSLSNAEKQHAFAEYIAAGLHLHSGDDLSTVPGTVKSLRTIQRDCPFYSVGHIGKLLIELGINASREDVKPYRHSYGDEWEGPSEDDIVDEDGIQLAAFREHLKSAVAALGLLSYSRRTEALDELKALALALSSSPSEPRAHTPLEI